MKTNRKPAMKRHLLTKMTAKSCATLILVSSGILVGQTAVGQEMARNETVANRARPELDALGIHLGGFLLFPELAVSGMRNSNIYADDVDEISDSIYVLSPRVNLKSNWNNHALNFGVDADIYEYRDYSTEDREDYSVWGEGRLDTGRSRFFLGEVSHRRLHEDRGSPDDVRGIEPTAYDRDEIAISYQAPRGQRRLYTQFFGEHRILDFEDTPGATGIINNDDRDRRKMSGTARLGYGLQSTYAVFLQGSAHSVEYDSQFDDSGFERSSTGYEVALGTTLDFSGETFGDIFVGYLSETYDDARFDRIDGSPNWL